MLYLDNFKGTSKAKINNLHKPLTYLKRVFIKNNYRFDACKEHYKKRSA